MSERELIDRRGALAVLSAGIAAFWTAAVAAVTGVFASAPLFAPRRGREVSLGPVDGLGADFRGVDVRDRVEDGWYSSEETMRIYARVDETGAPVVLSGTCTHLGCTVQWDAGAAAFKCPCHGGVYGADGRVIEGPPPRPLQALHAEVRDGELFARLS